VSRAETARRHCQTTPPRPAAATRMTSPPSAAIAGRRLAHFTARSRTPARRARIGSPASHRSRSAAGLVPRPRAGGTSPRFPRVPSGSTLLRRSAPQQLTPQAGTPRFARTGNGVWRVAPALPRGDRPDDRLASARDVPASRHDRRLSHRRANVPGTCWPTSGAAGCLAPRRRRQSTGSALGTKRAPPTPALWDGRRRPGFGRAVRRGGPGRRLACIGARSRPSGLLGQG